MIYYISWISFLIIITSIQAYFSVQNNSTKQLFPFIGIIFMEIMMLPLWPLVSRYSKNLLFDACMYDVLQFLTYTVFLIFLGGY